jgi:ribosomal protein S18 acetylase RimI-like enzyme
MSAAAIERLDAGRVREHLDGLAGVLKDCVDGGAGIRFLAPFSHEDARAAFTQVADDVEAGKRVLVAALADGEVVGTVQIVLALQQNSPHRGEIVQLLVHRGARRQGIAQRLMERAEAEALVEGRTLLTLDTADETAERLYERLGWTRVGEIPNYALTPDGRPSHTTIFWKALA